MFCGKLAKLLIRGKLSFAKLHKSGRHDNAHPRRKPRQSYKRVFGSAFVAVVSVVDDNVVSII